MGRVVINRAAIRALANHPAVQEGVRQAAERGANYARGIAPVKTGQYKASIHVASIRGGQRIITDAPHARIVEWGTRPHIITPTTKQALFWPGARHPVRAVHHPGTRAQHVLTRTADWLMN